jgi:TFIIF-interacting CTD phosphatase-like protein
MEDRIKLVLDIDNTLLVCTLGDQINKMVRTPDYVTVLDGQIAGFYFRPFLRTFLRCCAKWFDLIVWTAGVESYAETVVNIVFPQDIPRPPVYHREHCTIVEDITTTGPSFVKDLRKLQGFREDKFLLLDDNRSSFHLTPNNGVELPPFMGRDDDDLFLSLLPHLWGIYRVGRIGAPGFANWMQLSHHVLEKYESHFLKDCPVDLTESYVLWRLLKALDRCGKSISSLANHPIA